MVEQGDLDGLGGVAQEVCDLDVRHAGGRIAAGVVVRADERARRLADRRPEDLAGMRQGRRRRARGNLDPLQEAVLPVETQDPEFLHLQARGDGLQVGGDQLRATQERRLAGLLAGHPARKLQDGDQLVTLNRADSPELPEVGVPPGEQGRKGPGLGHQAGGEGEHVLPPGAAAQQEGQQLGVAKGRGSESYEALLRSFALDGRAKPIGGAVRRLARGGVGLHQPHNSRSADELSQVEFALLREPRGLGPLQRP